MDARELLRTYTLEELRRLVPPGHYLLRPHSHQADLELVELLLQFPERFELTPREHGAADALSALAKHELRSRDILSRAHPVRDFDDPTPPPGVTEDEQREMDGRREVMRRSALVFARMIDATVLAEAFRLPDQQGGPTRESAAAASTASASNKRKLTDAQLVEIRQRLTEGEPKAVLARAFDVHRRTIDRVEEGSPKGSRKAGRWHP